MADPIRRKTMGSIWKTVAEVAAEIVIQILKKRK